MRIIGDSFKNHHETILHGDTEVTLTVTVKLDKYLISVLLVIEIIHLKIFTIIVGYVNGLEIKQSIMTKMELPSLVQLILKKIVVF